MGHEQIVVLLEAFGASGAASVLVTLMTGLFSGSKKQQASEPNGARLRLQDENTWLRQQLELERARKGQ